MRQALSFGLWISVQYLPSRFDWLFPLSSLIFLYLSSFPSSLYSLSLFIFSLLFPSASRSVSVTVRVWLYKMIQKAWLKGKPLAAYNPKIMCLSLSHVRLFVTPWTVACQAPLSMRLSWPEYQSGLPFPSPGALPHSGIEPVFCSSYTGKQILCH